MTDKIIDISDVREARHKDADESRQAIAEVGGVIDETGVSLCIYGDDLIPEEVSQILAVAPTRAHRKGERIKSHTSDPARTGTYKTGAWILEMRGQAPREPEELTTALLDRLPEDETVWAELAARYRIWLRYGLHMESWNRGFELSSGLMARIARTRAEMGFDIYAYLGEEGG